MVQGPSGSGTSIINRILHGEAKQLMLPLDIPSERRGTILRHARDFATSFAPKLGTQLLMKFGVPMVGATTPVVIRMLDQGWEDELVPNLLVGSALGGVWGAMVGALIPRTSDGIRMTRWRSAGTAAAGGMLMAPAVALVSKYVADWATAPLRREAEEAKDRAEAAKDRAEEAEQELEQVDERAPDGDR